MNVRDEFTVDVYFGEERRNSYRFRRKKAPKEQCVEPGRKAWMEMERQPAENEILFRALERVLSGLSIKEGEAPQD